MKGVSRTKIRYEIIGSTVYVVDEELGVVLEEFDYPI
jgi:hypothetical protein